MGKYEISPYNAELMKLMKPFASKDQLRSALTGMYFDDNGVVCTNSAILALIKYKNQDDSVKFRGLYPLNVNVDLQDLFYVDYIEALARAAYLEHYIEFNTNEMLAILPEMIKSARQENHGICFIVKNGILKLSIHNVEEPAKDFKEVVCNSDIINYGKAFNGKLLLQILKIFEYFKIKNCRLCFGESENENVFFLETPFGQMTILLMGLFTSYSYFDDYFERESFKKLDNNNHIKGIKLKTEYGDYIKSIKDMKYRFVTQAEKAVSPEYYHWAKRNLL